MAFRAALPAFNLGAPGPAGDGETVKGVAATNVCYDSAKNAHEIKRETTTDDLLEKLGGKDGAFQTDTSDTMPYRLLGQALDAYPADIDTLAQRCGLPLTPKEVEIFQLLASHPGKVYSREKILSLVWGYDYFGDTRAVDTQIKRIRQKLPGEEIGWAIKTVYGVGYRFEVYNGEEEPQR